DTTDMREIEKLSRLEPTERAKMRYSPRFWMSVCFIAVLLLVILPGKPIVAAANQVSLIVGGDVEWSLNYPTPTVRYRVVDPKPYGKPVFGKLDVRDQVTGDWPP